MSGSPIRTWIELPAGDKFRLAAMLLSLPLVSLLLRLRGMEGTLAIIRRTSRRLDRRIADAAAIEQAKQLVRLGEIAGRRGPTKITCLRQSLLVYWVLRRRGYSPSIALGVRKHAEEGFGAHAWVELEGQSLNRHGSDFVRVQSFAGLASGAD